MESGKPRHKNYLRTQEVGEVARGLKRMATTWSVPVVALAQLNRGVETRAQRSPMMADVRESGEVEVVTDRLFSLHREEIYDETIAEKGVAEIKILKNRWGPLGRVSVAYDNVTTTFRNLARGRDVPGYGD